MLGLRGAPQTQGPPLVARVLSTPLPVSFTAATVTRGGAVAYRQSEQGFLKFTCRGTSVMFFQNMSLGLVNLKIKLKLHRKFTRV